MIKHNKKLKALVLSMGLGAAMLMTTSVQAQVINLLDEYYDELDQKNSQNAGPLLRGDYSISGNTNEGIALGDVESENPTPVGSGIIVLMAAGAGYALLKRKEDKQ